MTSNRLLKALFPALPLILLLLVLSVAATTVGGTFLKGAVTEALITTVLVVGLSIFVANSGVVSFGHAGFAMIGAYAAAWQTCCSGMRNVFLPSLPSFIATVDVPVPVAILLAGGVAGLVALFSGLAIMRLGATAASIALLSLLFVIKSFYENWNGMTAGQSTLVGLPLRVDLWVALTFAAAAIVVAQFYNTSTTALRLRASREEEAASRACGISTWRPRLGAFVLSAVLAGISGGLYGHYLGVLAVNMFWLDMTFVTIAMIVIGGMYSLTGAVVGTLVFSIVRELFRALERGIAFGGESLYVPKGTQEVVIALILLLILIVRPQGIVGNLEWRLPHKT
ncbi:branched-chain amino acid ABC transporter permease [Pseudochelatococcus sp. B33]